MAIGLYFIQVYSVDGLSHPKTISTLTISIGIVKPHVKVKKKNICLSEFLYLTFHTTKSLHRAIKSGLSPRKELCSLASFLARRLSTLDSHSRLATNYLPLLLLSLLVAPTFSIHPHTLEVDISLPLHTSPCCPSSATTTTWTCFLPKAVPPSPPALGRKRSSTSLHLAPLSGGENAARYRP